MKISVFIAALFCFYLLSAQDMVSEDTLPVIKTVMIADTVTSGTLIPEPIPVVDTQLLQSLTPKKKFGFDRVHLIIGLNYAYLNPFAMEKDVFNGSYYPVKDSAPVWTERNTKKNLAQSNRVSNFQFYLQANFWKGLFVGMNYQFFTIRGYKKDPNLGNLLSRTNSMFFLVSAKFGYVFELLKNKCLQIEPSVRIGGYTADDYYDSGKGKKVYFGADCKIRYLIKRKFGLSVGVDYDFLRYKKEEFNDLFQRESYQKTTISSIHLNAGICYNITIRTRK